MLDFRLRLTNIIIERHKLLMVQKWSATSSALVQTPLIVALATVLHWHERSNGNAYLRPSKERRANVSTNSSASSVHVTSSVTVYAFKAKSQWMKHLKESHVNVFSYLPWNYRTYTLSCAHNTKNIIIVVIIHSSSLIYFKMSSVKPRAHTHTQTKT